MLVVLLIAGLWAAGLLFVTGLCAAARRGDAESGHAAESAHAAEAAAWEPVVTAMPAREREPAVPPARAAA